jgi:steroid delta-isomerase-like uncharacterized protein
MPAEDARTVVQRYCEELWSEGKVEVADQIIGPSLWGKGSEGAKDSVRDIRASISGLKRTANDIVVEGEKVVSHQTYTGVHTGSGRRLPFAPTNARIETTGVVEFIVRDGKIVEEKWSVYDPDGFAGPISAAIVRRFIEEVHVQGDLDRVDDLVHPDYVLHDPALPTVTGRNSVRQVIAGIRLAFPDLAYTVEDLIAKGERVVARWTATGTHRGEFMGIPATGQPVSASGTSIYRFAEGKIAEEWKTWDVWGTMKQLGAGTRLEEGRA